MAKNKKLYIVKSRTYKGRWVKRAYPNQEVERNIYAERYLGVGERGMIQMNGMNYDRTKLLIFKSKKAAENACICANMFLKKLEVIGEYGALSLNDYAVIEYKPRKPITNMVEVPAFGGNGYLVRE